MAKASHERGNSVSVEKRTAIVIIMEVHNPSTGGGAIVGDELFEENMRRRIKIKQHECPQVGSQSLIEDDLATTFKDPTFGDNCDAIIGKQIVGQIWPSGQGVVHFGSLESNNDLGIPVRKGDTAEGAIKGDDGELHCFC